MRWKFSVAVALVALFSVPACGGNPTPTMSPGKPPLPASLSTAGPLLDSIGKAVPGLSDAQSILGVGSMLGFAKMKMPASEFGQISSALPGADALMSEAMNQGMPSTLGGLSDLTSFLGKSGISPQQISQIASSLGKSLGGKVSPALLNSFASVFK